jgi:SAM-dependent methyltransferase
MAVRQQNEFQGAASQRSYIETNRLAWDGWARSYSSAGRRAWTADELRWGLWNMPESEVGLLSDVEPGADVIELGSGTAAISAWLARLGMRPVAVDISRAQLNTAERFQDELGPAFSLVLGNAEDVPFDDESFDVAISEYGASLWCEPRRWIGEAHRLLRLHGKLIFLTNSPLLMACMPADGGLPTDRLLHDYFGSDRVEFTGEDAVEFHLTHGAWIDLLHAVGFAVERLIEHRAPHGRPRLPLVSPDWARRWPSEDIWVARKVLRSSETT